MSSFKQFDHESSYHDYQAMERLVIKRTRKPRMLRIIFVLLILMAIGAFALQDGNGLWSLLASSYFDNKLSAANTNEGITQQKWLNVMIVGSDQRKNEPSRSDTLMVVMINLKERHVQVLSIPRDTRVAIEGLEHKTKINHAHAKGGIQLTKKTVEGLLGIPIHKYVETNFEGFESIIDLLGGVDLDVEKRMYYPAEDINLKKGFQHLDGHHALAYVRFRSDGKGDLPRIERQHKFLGAVVDQALQPQTIVKLPKIMKEIYKYVQTDMTIGDFVVLAGEFANINSDKVRFIDIPGKPDYVNGVSYYIVNEDKLKQLMADVLNGRDPEVVPNSENLREQKAEADLIKPEGK